MIEIEQLKKRWESSVRFRALHAAMSLEKEGLMLGVGTVLAKRNFDGALALDGDEARLLTLFAVAYGRPVKPSVLGTIAKASTRAQAGDECMAAMLIALAGLPKFDDPTDSARRLFIADGLMRDGVNPRDIWTALDFAPAPLDELDKRYNPDQPRVPAGSGRTSGEWTSGDSSTNAEAPAAIAARVIARGAEGAAEAAGERASWELLLELGARSAGPLAFLSALLYSTPAGGERREGKVPGHPDLAWMEDEGLLTILRAPDDEVVLQAKCRADGTFRVLRYRGLERLLNEHSQVDPKTLPPEDPRSAQRDDEPRMCPEPPGSDKPQGTANSKRYVAFMKPLVNQPPTQLGLGYQLPNPFQGGDLVSYDDCQRSTGTMIEYKGTGYADKLTGKNQFDEFKKSVTDEWLDEATRQIEASQGRPVRWYFAENGALEFARTLFSSKKYKILNRIELVYAPLPGGDQ